MTLSEETVRAYVGILEEELVAAMGCTEPIAIAYASSIAASLLGTEPERIDVRLSGNLIKNVKSVVVPATGGLRGIEAAIAAGAVSARPDLKLEVLSVLGSEDAVRIKRILDEVPIEVNELDSGRILDLVVDAFAQGHSAHVHIADRHTNVIEASLDGRSDAGSFASEEAHVEGACGCDAVSGPTAVAADRSLLNVEDIVTFADEVDLDLVRPLLMRQVQLNMAIAEEGLTGDWGARIGKLLMGDGTGDVVRRAQAYAAAGSDARMSGCEMPVCILSGSGNQGITASVPVAVYAREKGASEDEMLRALLVSDLVSIHQKTGIGCLSAYCGAISAGCGCGCGICYLNGGRFREIAHTLVNSVAILSGTICDGAKASCAAKIAMAVSAGIMGYEMFQAGDQFRGGDGIVAKGVENTISNIGKLARQGMGETDKEIIRIMLGKS